MAPKRARTASTAAKATNESSHAPRDIELQLQSEGFPLVAGVDEAGRGPGAGPVVAAACIIPPHIFIPHIRDSKLMSEEERETAFAALTSHPEILHATSIQSHKVIDEINILQATMRAMEQAVASLPKPPSYILVDGPRLPAALDGATSRALVKGDQRSYCIAAASVIAKVTRDRIMMELDQVYPQYGFKQHKGYLTASHVAALKQHGPCEEHRRSFEPIKSMVGWVREGEEDKKTTKSGGGKKAVTKKRKSSGS